MPIDIGEGRLKIAPDFGPLERGLATRLPNILKDTGRKMQFIGAGLTAAVTLPILGIGKAAVGASIDFETAFTGVRKTVNELAGATTKELDDFAEEFRKISRVTPIAAENLLRIGEIAGQLGIQFKNIPAFSKVMADLAVTTDLTVESASFNLSRLANVMKLPQEQIESVGDTIVNLGNNLATTESAIVSMASRISGSAVAIGLNTDEVLALSGALSSVGVAAELGGTAISRVMISISGAVDAGGEKLEQFAEVAGLSAEDFAQKWRAKPAEALLAFISGLGKIQEEGTGVFNTLAELGFSGVRVGGVLLRAASASSIFEKALGLATESQAALKTEVDLFNSTTANKIVIAQNNIRDAMREFGDAALPWIQRMAEITASAAQGIAQLNPAAKAFVGLGLAIAGLAGPFLLLLGTFIQTRAALKLYTAITGQSILATGANAKSQQTLAVGYASVATAASAATAAMVTNTGVQKGAFLAGFSQGPGFGFNRAAGTPGAVAIGATATGAASITAASRRFLTPTFANIGRNLGIVIGAQLAAGMVSSFNTQEGTIADEVKGVVANAISGAGFGTLIGGLVGQPLIGAGVGALLGGAVGFLTRPTGDTGPSAAVLAERELLAQEIAARQEEVGPFTFIDPTVLAIEGASAGGAAAKAVAEAFIKESTKVIPPALQQFNEFIQDATGEWQATITQFSTETPNIFGRDFVENTKKAQHDLEHAVEFDKIVSNVEDNIADMEEINAAIIELADFPAIIGQITEASGPEALAIARTFIKEFRDDPEGIFSLEADLLRLTGGVRESFLDLASIPSDVSFVEAALAVLSPAALAIPGVLEAELEKARIFKADAIVAGLEDARPEMVEKMAVIFTGALGDAALKSFRDFTLDLGGVDPTAIGEGVKEFLLRAELPEVFLGVMTAAFEAGAIPDTDTLQRIAETAFEAQRTQFIEAGKAVGLDGPVVGLEVPVDAKFTFEGGVGRFGGTVISDEFLIQIFEKATGFSFEQFEKALGAKSGEFLVDGFLDILKDLDIAEDDVTAALSKSLDPVGGDLISNIFVDALSVDGATISPAISEALEGTAISISTKLADSLASPESRAKLFEGIDGALLGTTNTLIANQTDIARWKNYGASRAKAVTQGFNENIFSSQFLFPTPDTFVPAPSQIPIGVRFEAIEASERTGNTTIVHVSTDAREDTEAQVSKALTTARLVDNLLR